MYQPTFLFPIFSFFQIRNGFSFIVHNQQQEHLQFLLECYSDEEEIWMSTLSVRALNEI